MRAISLVAAAMLLTAAGAGAATTVPPGHAGGNQYVETVPGAAGETSVEPVHGSSIGAPPSDSGGGGAGGGGEVAPSPSEVLGAKTTKRFEKAGALGRATADLAAAGGPTGNAAAAEPKHQDIGSGDGESPLKQVVGHLTGTSGDSGMGLLMPLLILMSAVLAGAFILGRRRPTRPRD